MSDTQPQPAPTPNPAPPPGGVATARSGETHDPTHLRIMVNELFAAVGTLDDLAASTAERPDMTLERAAGVQMAKAQLLDPGDGGPPAPQTTHRRPAQPDDP